jgi:hypothetical protein
LLADLMDRMVRRRCRDNDPAQRRLKRRNRMPDRIDDREELVPGAVDLATDAANRSCGASLKLAELLFRLPLALIEIRWI